MFHYLMKKCIKCVCVCMHEYEYIIIHTYIPTCIVHAGTRIYYENVIKNLENVS